MGATKVRPDEQTRGEWRFTRFEERPGPVALHLGSCVFCRTLAALAVTRADVALHHAALALLDQHVLGDGERRCLGGPAATRSPR